MKKIAAVLIAVALLSGCKPSVDDVKRDAEIARVCEEGGGRIVYNGWNEMKCKFGEKP